MYWSDHPLLWLAIAPGSYSLWSISSQNVKSQTGTGFNCKGRQSESTRGILREILDPPSDTAITVAADRSPDQNN